MDRWLWHFLFIGKDLICPFDLPPSLEIWTQGKLLTVAVSAVIHAGIVNPEL